MRDVERLREKREFSLDDRQVWALGFAALLLLGSVFALGLAVGRKMAFSAPAPGDLAALDAAARPQASDVRPQAAPGVTPVAPQKPVEVVVEKAPEKEPPQEKPAQGRAPAATTPPPRPATVVAPPPAPVTVASIAPIQLTPPPRDLGAFTVQIGASREKSEAQRMENKARGAGLKPYVVEADLGAKGVWYRVRVGAFKDKDAANGYRRDVERELRAAAVVMPTH